MSLSHLRESVCQKGLPTSFVRSNNLHCAKLRNNLDYCLNTSVLTFMFCSANKYAHEAWLVV